MKLNGIFPALATPFDNGEVSAERLAENLARYESLELGGYLALGSTGEGILLDDGERRSVLRTVREAIPDRKPLVAGVSAESTRGASRQVREAAACGADFVLVLTPHYFRSQMTAAALLEHFRTVADESPVPVLLYNVPKFTGLEIPPEVVVALSRHGNIAGLKESSGSPDYLLKILGDVGSGFRVLCGDASILRVALRAGAAGGVLAAAVALPEPFIRLAHGGTGEDPEMDAWQRSAGEAARSIAGVHGVPGVKAAMDLRGLYGGPPRCPLQPVSNAVREAIDRTLSGLVDDGILKRKQL